MEYRFGISDEVSYMRSNFAFQSCIHRELLVAQLRSHLFRQTTPHSHLLPSKYRNISSVLRVIISIINCYLHEVSKVISSGSYGPIFELNVHLLVSSRQSFMPYGLYFLHENLYGSFWVFYITK